MSPEIGFYTKEKLEELTPEKDTLYEWFMEMGYGYSWDFSKHDGLRWHEFLDPDTGQIACQIGQGVSKERFLECWSDSESQDDFFMAADLKSKEWPALKRNIRASTGQIYRGPKK